MLGDGAVILADIVAFALWPVQKLEFSKTRFWCLHVLRLLVVAVIPSRITDDTYLPSSLYLRRSSLGSLLEHFG